MKLWMINDNDNWIYSVDLFAVIYSKYSNNKFKVNNLKTKKLLNIL